MPGNSRQGAGAPMKVSGCAEMAVVITLFHARPLMAAKYSECWEVGCYADIFYLLHYSYHLARSELLCGAYTGKPIDGEPVDAGDFDAWGGIQHALGNVRGGD
jgi:hypothetical protein